MYVCVCVRERDSSMAGRHQCTGTLLLAYARQEFSVDARCRASVHDSRCQVAVAGQE